MCQPAKLEEPTYSTLPCWTSRSMACQSSSQGVSRSTWCIWYRSMWSVCSRRSDPSQARRMFSADSLFSLGQSPIDPKTLVASTTLSRRDASGWPPRTPSRREGGEMEERIIAADPVADPQGYRRELLALLGDDDPAQVLAATLAELQERTSGLPGELVARRPEPG